MLRIRDLNISGKLTLIATASAVAALVCILVAFVFQDLRLLRKFKAERIESHLSVLTSNLAYALVHQDAKNVNNLLYNASSPHGMVAGEVYNRAGELVGQFTSTEQQESEMSPMGYRFGTRDYIKSIVWQGQPVGQLNVRFSFADVEMRALYLGAYGLIACFFAVVIAIVLARLVQKIISQPLLSLHALSQKVITSGDYSLRADVVSRDELGQLADAFNRMLSQVQQRDAMLEKQVDKRTQELQRLADEFRYRALHDSLTGLANRALLNEEFIRACAHSNRVGKYFALMLLDLDNFKTINDTHGHDVGDELLKQLAVRIKGALRGEDLVCRLGGDEFVVLLEDVETEQHVEAVGNTLIGAMKKPIETRDYQFNVGISIGASIFPLHGSTMDELKRHADIAMYQAKVNGKNRVQVFVPGMATPDKKRQQIQNDLPGALAAGELELYLQPQVDVAAGRVWGCEALIRWQHPERGLLQPKDFIPFAEDNGSIVDIDRYVLDRAVKLLKYWSTQGLDLSLSVNLSTAFLLNNSLARQDIVAATGAAGEQGGRLLLEVSENVWLEHPDEIERWTLFLKEQGVRVVLDDFGAVVGAVKSLTGTGFYGVKLDRHLFNKLHSQPEQSRVTAALLAFAQSLELRTFAEAVEREDHLSELTTMGCRVVQGNVFAPAMPQHQFLRWLSRSPLRGGEPFAKAPNAINEH